MNEIISAKVIKVIEVKITRGTGTEENPVRSVTQYWSMSGQLLAEYDPEKDNFVTADLSENEDEWEETTQQQIDIDALKERVEQLGKKVADLEEEVQRHLKVKYTLDGREIAETVKQSVKGSYS